MDSLIKEEWRPVPGFPDYEASDKGRLRRNIKTVTRSYRNGRLIEEISKEEISYFFYSAAQIQPLKSTCEISTSGLHRMIARAFLGQPAKGDMVWFKNLDKKDMRPDNMAYVSRKEFARLREQNHSGRKILGSFPSLHLVSPSKKDT